MGTLMLLCPGHNLSFGTSGGYLIEELKQKIGKKLLRVGIRTYSNIPLEPNLTVDLNVTLTSTNQLRFICQVDFQQFQHNSTI